MNPVTKLVCEGVVAAGAAGAAEQSPEAAASAGAIYAAVMLIVKGIVELVRIYRARKTKGQD